MVRFVPLASSPLVRVIVPVTQGDRVARPGPGDGVAQGAGTAVGGTGHVWVAACTGTAGPTNPASALGLTPAERTQLQDLAEALDAQGSPSAGVATAVIDAPRPIVRLPSR
jgi:hypothetical protein